ncbi:MULTISPECIES: carboxymuconolactone decarboxylase family protein [unclassified Variovorax]|uniref:carboxymuconolactone decarboxylase family protein n=1 Tax=unclassified Variovorax TaxID=663243 RepID=UPI0025790773|nr:MULTISPECIES: carboxymuconolactone decarboxylase family protein [unclassified Variovorax]MDM0091070.1 carboxymuconolactone decarboxylase family protein [Variovorax sp. J22G40]MDM0148928.1 carboxymuconolactone decarboxylase family protein [Variovorax sp. J2P1-31]
MNTPRLSWFKIAPKAYQAMLGVNGALAGHTLGQRLFEIVQTRVSQLNGCAFCLDMHVRDLRKLEVDWQHINSIATWREVGFYDARERAALHWAESLTRLAEHHGDRDADFAQLQAVFSDAEIVDLTVAIAQINAWNRLGVGMRLPVAEKTIA